MDSRIFFRTIISGLIATYVMFLFAFFQGGLGLPVIDIGHFLTESFNYVHDHDPYSIVWGNTAFFVMGILLALIWVTFLHNRFTQNWFFQSLIYAVILSVVAGLLVSPVVALSAGERFGIFYMNTWVPGLIIIAGFTIHFAYSFVLMLCLKIAGVSEMLNRPEKGK